MANEKQLKILKQGVKNWNIWREKQGVWDKINSRIDLSHANFEKVDLANANLFKVNLSGANLRRTDLSRANLTWADLRGAKINKTILFMAHLTGANISGTIIKNSSFYSADLRGAKLKKSTLKKLDLTDANLNLVNLKKGIITNCQINGISAWNMNLEGVKQSNLIITPLGEPTITVDNLEVAQFVYLLLNNEKIRNVIDTIGEKGVLILGRFTKERKAVLDAIRDRLRQLGFVPMMFDFEKPTKKDYTETIKTLAGLSRFIIADITDPKCIPLEMQAIVPDFMVPVVPIIQEPEKPFAMIQDLQQKCEWVFDVIAYDSKETLIGALDREIVQPAKEMADKLLSKRGEKIKMRRLKDDI